MKQLIIPVLPVRGGEVVLDDDQSHYLRVVRRMSVGDEIVCADGAGVRVATRIVRIADDAGGAVTLSVGDPAPDPVAPGVQRELTVMVALLKGKKIDLVVRQLTEIGVARIVPVVLERSISRPDRYELQRKAARWEQIAREASQQCGRLTVPAVIPSISLTPATEPVFQPTRAIAFHESGATVVSTPEAATADTILIGPEGGLAPDEVAGLRGTGWHIRRLPTPVLRAETAAVVAAALVLYAGSEYTAAHS